MGHGRTAACEVHAQPPSPKGPYPVLAYMYMCMYLTNITVLCVPILHLPCTFAPKQNENKPSPKTTPSSYISFHFCRCVWRRFRVRQLARGRPQVGPFRLPYCARTARAAPDAQAGGARRGRGSLLWRGHLLRWRCAHLVGRRRHRRCAAEAHAVQHAAEAACAARAVGAMAPCVLHALDGVEHLVACAVRGDELAVARAVELDDVDTVAAQVGAEGADGDDVVMLREHRARGARQVLRPKVVGVPVEVAVEVGDDRELRLDEVVLDVAQRVRRLRVEKVARHLGVVEEESDRVDEDG
mmetsp:Transcript_23632/g.58388  ORF Transcript_23632/g.58388 Transcript_23632/m.58388 type:complete len:298 (-) Transcript_23632:1410-2303(-)